MVESGVVWESVQQHGRSEAETTHALSFVRVMEEDRRCLIRHETQKLLIRTYDTSYLCNTYEVTKRDNLAIIQIPI